MSRFLFPNIEDPSPRGRSRQGLSGQDPFTRDSTLLSTQGAQVVINYQDTVGVDPESLSSLSYLEHFLEHSFCLF